MKPIGEDGHVGQVPHRQVGPPPESYQCNICHMGGHWIIECPNKPPRAVPDHYICNICNLPGHFIR